MSRLNNNRPKRVFLCDLTHVSQIIASEIFPLNIGYVGTYCKKVFGDQIDVSLFKYPNDLIEAFKSGPPDLIGFSSYIWNIDLGYSFAERIKQSYPEIPIVFGGPNYPAVKEEQEIWLRKRPAIDIFIYKDAEIPLTSIIEYLSHGASLEEIKRVRLASVHALSDDRFYTGDLAERIKNLDLIPSPYLEGYFDKFFDGKLMCMLQTNRGCPFSCTFCVEGASYYNKINRFSEERVYHELEYMAGHSKGNKNLFIADSNFGMYKEDLGIAKAIARVHETFGFPEYIYATTGKNEKVRILQCADVLKDLLRVSATVQSLDPNVLKEVKRTNISADKLVEMADTAKHSNSNTYADVILALPGDSKEAHFGTIKQLVEVGVDYLTLFTSILLESTEMATQESRRNHGMITRYRVLPRCFGSYRFNGDGFISVESEEVCVGNKTLSYADYLECREFDLTVGIFYNDRIFYEVNALLKHFNISVYDWLSEIHHQRTSFPKPLKDVYAQFLKETDGELWREQSSLLNFIKGSEKTLGEYTSGERGNNVFYTARAAVLVNCVKELHEVAFQALKMVLKNKEIEMMELLENYLMELQHYSELRKMNPLSLNGNHQASFHYDFPALEQAAFKVIPSQRLEQSISLKFVHTENQKKMLTSQLDAYGTSRVGLARLLGKNPVKKFYRSIVKASSSSFEERKEKEWLDIS